MFLVNSCSHQFIATLTSLRSKSDHQQGRTFSRSYGTILPSSFTRVLSSALGYSPCPPVSVWGTVTRNLKLRSFSWKHGISHSSAVALSPSRLSVNDLPDLPKRSAYTLGYARPTAFWPSLLRPSIAVAGGSGILTGFPSTTHFCLALGAD